MKRLSIILTAIALVLGMAQCKKEKQQQANENGDGQYVSVTAGHNDGAYYLLFYLGYVGPYSSLSRFNGCSVRLVR